MRAGHDRGDDGRVAGRRRGRRSTSCAQAIDALASPDRCGRVPGRPRRIHVPGCRPASTLELIEVVEQLDALAPLHNRRAAAVMRAGLAALPDVAHVACFDTAFHATLPEEAWRYPLPADWVERFEIRRYGFHGLSVAWATRRAADRSSAVQ